jgi:hypothetical protein
VPGRELLTVDPVNAVSAICAANLAGHYEVSIEIALHVGLLDEICIGCARTALGEAAPKFVFEQLDVGLKISTCDDCTEAFARWVAAGGLKRWLSDQTVRAGIESLQQQINHFLPGRSIEVDGIIGPATMAALKRCAVVRRALQAI